MEIELAFVASDGCPAVGTGLQDQQILVLTLPTGLDKLDCSSPVSQKHVGLLS
jgi:hypothetical protein